jgi:hypothetical protein
MPAMMNEAFIQAADEAGKALADVLGAQDTRPESESGDEGEDDSRPSGGARRAGVPTPGPGPQRGLPAAEPVRAVLDIIDGA